MPEISETEKSQLKKAVAKAEKLIVRWEWCAAELYGRLCRTFDEKTAAAAVASVVSRDLVNDERFARQYADYLKRAKCYAPIRIRLELTAKGVARELASEAAENSADDDEERAKRLTELAEKKYGRDLREADNGIAVRKVTARAVRYFTAKGYRAGEIVNIIKDITANL